ncbi:MAG: TerS protein [Gammaproteobacteria bacterium]|nr:MAG: TerS protein [Gammaproteobacteria bacterium]RTZ75579.1 MAG: TerS protein [Gammaproteobacteria bacterium]RTZ77974.1 MAG: TerS protein [Gammaproteobacteria bacterium]
MKKPRKSRSDSTAAAVNAFQAGQLEPPPHVRLRKGDLPFWRSIVSCRPAESWTAADLEQAANLARCKADIERLQLEIDDEGDVVVNQRGTPIVNPKHTLLETLSRRTVALSRILQIHAVATAGDSRDLRKAARAEREAKRLMQEADDGLIPKPH